MKMKKTIAALAGLVIAASSFGQGTVVFNNTPLNGVTDAATGMAVPPNTAIAGLYYSTDLGATANTGVANDGWLLAVTAPVSTVPVPSLYGTFSANGGNPVPVPGTSGGQQILMQVRAWSVGFASYAEAFNAGAKVGHSAQFQTPASGLGGGANPPPATSGLYTGFIVMTVVPEPSTIVLGLLGGLGAMVLLRRRS